MSVQKIEQAITQLPDSQVTELSQWIEEYQNQRWDEQIERDANAGRFDALIAQAEADYAAGLARPL